MTDGQAARSIYQSRAAGGPQDSAVELTADVPYRAASGYSPALNTLDLYASARSARVGKQQIIVFLHGGNWRGSDKACFPGPQEHAMPAWFVQRDCIFASVNFRLLGRPDAPGTTVAEMADDVAKAIKWLTVNGRSYGGRPQGIILAGFSSGAHLAALVAADQSLHARHRLEPGAISGVIGMDVPFYDVPAAFDVMQHGLLGQSQQGQRFEAALEVFGKDPADHLRFSPAAHVGPWLRSTRFLLLSAGLHAGRRQDFSNQMSADFARRLQKEQIVASHVHLGMMEHEDMLRNFRLLPARQVEQFFGGK
jgi:acetyl esterase/lipase